MRVSEPYVTDQAIELVTDALRSRYLSPRGHFSRRFEWELSRANDDCFVKLMNSGTSALEVALLALKHVMGLSGGVVVVPAYTCVDTAMAVLKAGFRIAFADVDAQRLCVTPETLEAAWTPEVVGALVVHVYGMAVGIETYRYLRSKSAFIVDDAAEAYGVTVSGHHLTDLADAVAFSFRGDKPLPVGTGGAVLTKHSGVAGMLEALVGLNSPRGWQRYWVLSSGMSYEFPDVLSAVGIGQLGGFEESLRRRWEVVGWYVRHGLPSPFRQGDVPWKFPVWVRDAACTAERLRKAAVETSPPFTPLHKLPMFHNVREMGAHEVVYVQRMVLPVAERCWRMLLALPLHPFVEEEDVVRIVEVVRDDVV